ncbi:hypothetical protein TO73_1669 [Thermus aquaticus Y51MC23]|uniref:Uncharacterized protein n=1 Tax=Thermus aquaticus (strain ATCC BAA-2747 / Y51MC23) TaxID=498848 RepID=A0ABM5VND3_THEA5|nr:hypothetical protein TO73_1669 [Thermus aquaticus Y51MC23]
MTLRAFFSHLGLTSSPHTLFRVGGEGGFVNPVGWGLRKLTGKPYGVQDLLAYEEEP